MILAETLNAYSEAALISAGILYGTSLIPLLGRNGQRPWALPYLQGVHMYSCLCVLLALAGLIYNFLADNFSNQLVTLNSERGQPWLYKLGAVWGNHEGSLLLWVVFLSIFAVIFTKWPKDLARAPRVQMLALLDVLAALFLLFICVASNPFLTLRNLAQTGIGLNPLLQDPGLLIHPPTLYEGHVALIIPFAAAWAKMRSTPEHAGSLHKIMYRWGQGAWLLLTVGIALGAYWAYYELGWGGYWFWDPVETTSLLPWLAATVLVHSGTQAVLRERVSRVFSYSAFCAFTMSVVGLFLVRSGLLVSVHTFARNDKALVGLGAIAAVVCLIALWGGVRMPRERDARAAPYWTREGLLHLQAWIFYGILLFLLSSIAFPIIYEGLYGQNFALSEHLFNSLLLPVVGVLLMMMAAVTFVPMHNLPLKETLRGLNPLIGFLLVAASILLVFVTQAKILYVSLIFLASAVLLSSLYGLVRGKWENGFMHLAHMGFALMLMGVAVDKGWQAYEVFPLKVGETRVFQGAKVILADIEFAAESTYNRQTAHVHLQIGEGAVHRLQPEQRRYRAQSLLTSETDRLSKGVSQYYISIGPMHTNGAQVLQISWHPCILLIWLGVLMILLGYGAQMVGRIKNTRNRPVRRSS